MALSALALACLATPVKAQRFAVVATCGTLTQAAPAVGSAGIVTMDQNGVLCTSATGGGGGGAVTVANGADVAQGTTTDAVCATDTGTCTSLALAKRTNQNISTLVTNLGTANANGQATMTSSSPVVIASNQSAVPVTLNSTTVTGTVAVTQSGTWTVTVDPCATSAKVNQAISFQTTALTQQIAASGSNKIYLCSIVLIASTATNFSISGGTGSNCASNQLGIFGVAGTATHGIPLAANGGFTVGSGSGTIGVTAASSEICLVQSGAGDLVGNMTYVYAP